MNSIANKNGNRLPRKNHKSRCLTQTSRNNYLHRHERKINYKDKIKQSFQMQKWGKRRTLGKNSYSQ